MGAKRSLIVGAHIVDSGYEGEVFVDLHNVGKEVQYIASGDKVAQLVLVPVVHFRPIRLQYASLYRGDITMSNRGEGTLGSTNSPTGLCAPSVDPALVHPEKDNNHPLDGMPSGF